MNATPLTRRLTQGRRRRGATMLVFYFILLPTMLMGLLVLLNRVEAAQQQGLALEARVRAQCLAESAAAVARVRTPSTPQRGTLPGMGSWSLSAATTPQTLRATGVAALGEEHYERSLLLVSSGTGGWQIDSAQTALHPAATPPR